MKRLGEAWQNGYAERLIRTIKEEEVDLSEYQNYHDAYQQIGHFIRDVYTRKRIHSSLGNLTPAEFEFTYREKLADYEVTFHIKSSILCPAYGGQFIYFLNISARSTTCSLLTLTGTIAMIKYSVFYPNLEGKRFDMDYYCNKYLPMVRAKLGAACKGVAVEAGMSGGEPGSKPTYIAVGHLYFDSVEAYHVAFVPHVLEFRADRPNYTDIEPIRQISEVKLQISFS